MVARGSAVISTVYKLRFIPLDPSSFSCCALSVACTRKRDDRLSDLIDTRCENAWRDVASNLFPEEDSSLKVDEMFTCRSTRPTTNTSYRCYLSRTDISSPPSRQKFRLARYSRTRPRFLACSPCEEIARRHTSSALTARNSYETARRRLRANPDRRAASRTSFEIERNRAGRYVKARKRRRMTSCRAAQVGKWNTYRIAPASAGLRTVIDGWRVDWLRRDRPLGD